MAVGQRADIGDLILHVLIVPGDQPADVDDHIQLLAAVRKRGLGLGDLDFRLVVAVREADDRTHAHVAARKHFLDQRHIGRPRANACGAVFQGNFAACADVRLGEEGLEGAVIQHLGDIFGRQFHPMISFRMRGGDCPRFFRGWLRRLLFRRLRRLLRRVFLFLCLGFLRLFLRGFLQFFLGGVFLGFVRTGALRAAIGVSHGVAALHARLPLRILRGVCFQPLAQIPDVRIVPADSPAVFGHGGKQRVCLFPQAAQRFRVRLPAALRHVQPVQRVDQPALRFLRLRAFALGQKLFWRQRIAVTAEGDLFHVDAAGANLLQAVCNEHMPAHPAVRVQPASVRAVVERFGGHDRQFPVADHGNAQGVWINAAAGLGVERRGDLEAFTQRAHLQRRAAVGDVGQNLRVGYPKIADKIQPFGIGLRQADKRRRYRLFRKEIARVAVRLILADTPRLPRFLQIKHLAAVRRAPALRHSPALEGKLQFPLGNVYGLPVRGLQVFGGANVRIVGLAGAYAGRGIPDERLHPRRDLQHLLQPVQKAGTDLQALGHGHGLAAAADEVHHQPLAQKRAVLRKSICPGGVHGKNAPPLIGAVVTEVAVPVIPRIQRRGFQKHLAVIRGGIGGKAAGSGELVLFGLLAHVLHILDHFRGKQRDEIPETGGKLALPNGKLRAGKQRVFG